MKAIRLQKRQTQGLLDKLFFRLPKILALISVLVSSLPTASRAAGVTIITHGYNSDTITWVDAMALAIRGRSDFPGTQSTTYRVTVTRFFQLGLDVTPQLVAGGDPLLTDSGELIILLDWSDIDSFGFEETGTGDVAEAVVEKLLDANFISGLNKSLVEFPVHLIGHSRGGSLVTALARVLGESGVVVDHVTTLDPRPLSWDEHSAQDSTEVSRFANVVFADNYYQHSFGTFPLGNPVSGAKNINLSLIVSGVGPEAHTDIHTYYHGTIDTTTSGPVDGRDVLDSWYTYYGTGPRASIGYCWSRQVGTDRPRESVSADYGGFFGSGVSITPNGGPQWPNVIIKDVPDATVNVGSLLGLSCWYRDTDSGGNITVYLDQDRNPYNVNSTLLTQASATTYATTSSNPSTRSISASTAGVTPNTYYLCLKITDSTGLTRYDYWLEPIMLAAIGVTVQTSHANQGLDFTVDGDSFSSPQTFQWQDGIQHTLTVLPYQLGDDDGYYGFKQWSDGITTITRFVQPSGNVTYTAIFTNSGAVVTAKTPSADTYVLQDSSNSNGQQDDPEIWLRESPSSSDSLWGLVKFNLTSIPSGSAVSYAELRLKKYLGPAGPVQIKEVSGAWSESATWNNKPTSGSAFVAEASDTGDGYLYFRSTDYAGVKSMVQGFVNDSSGNNGFYLRSGMPSTDSIAIRSREHTTSSERPTLIVHYMPPPDTTGDPVVNLIAKKSSTGSTITANNWQHDNDPYFSWSTANTVYPIIGYSFALDNPTPDNTVDVTVPYYQYSSDSISDGPHTFYVKSLDANGNWGPVASFVIKVDAGPPTSGTISINDGAASTWSPIVTLNNLGASAAPSGLDEMKFSNDGSTWSAYESYASTKTGWDLFGNGGDTNIGTKMVYVRYKDNAGNESAVFSDAIAYSPMPVITVQPAGDTLSLVGGNVTLSVTAEGAPTLTYQWRMNGAAIMDATNSTLALTNLQLNQTSLYSVSVSNAFGGTISAGGWLEVSTIVAWGANDDGEIGEQVLIPRGLTNVTMIAAGGSHSLALTADGAVVGWGNNDSGQTDIPLSAVSNVVAIAAGGSHSLALRTDGKLFIWGDGWEQEDIPGSAMSNIVSIAAGGSHSLVLKSDGTVIEWGGQSDVPFELDNVIGIAAGGEHSLAVRSDGQVFAWGNNRRGQTDVPVDLTNVIAVAAGQAHSVALKSDGTVAVWGEYNYDGYQPYPNPEGLSNVVAIAAGGGHALALRDDGSVFAWGLEWAGQVNVPSDLLGIKIASVSAGGMHSLALIGNGPPIIRKSTVPSVIGSSALAVLKVDAFGESPLSYQWQWNGQNLAAATNATLRLTDVQFSQAGFYSVIVSNALGGATSVTNELTVVPVLILKHPASQVGYFGNGLTLSVTAQGENPLHYQWMFNGGEIVGATNQMLILTNVNFGDAGAYSVVITNILGGTTSHLASAVVSSVVPWGYYDPSNGLQLMTTPTGLSNVVAVAAGQNHGLLLQSNGMVTVWGGFRDLDASEEILPMIVPEGLSNVVAIAAGSYHSLALHDNGTVTAWGGYWNGLTNVPFGLSNVVAIAGGSDHSLALRSDDTVVAWGDNSNDQLGVPAGLSNVVAIAAGGYHSLALRIDGTVSAWGGNWSGQAAVPEGLSNVVAIAGGWSHSFALKADGTTVFWGDFDNEDPEPPSHLDEVISIASGLDYCLALHQNGKVDVWGSFYDRWNGNDFPIVIPEGFKNTRSLAAGETFSLALLGDGEPVLARQPINRTIFAGQQIVLNALAGSTEPLSYQWQFNGTNINGGTDALLIIDPARVENAGYYSVIVSNSHGVVVGGPWLVAVSRPTNDNFVNRHTIASDFGVTTGNSLDATKEVGESNHAGVAGGSSVWWTWTPFRAGTATITTDGSSFDTVLAVYTGGGVNALALVAANDDQNVGLQSKVAFPVLRGIPYHIAVDGKLGASGNIIMTRSFEGPHLTEARVAGNAVQFILNGPAGNPYQLQISSNLVDWVTTSTVTIPEIGSILLSDQMWANQPQRFYRVTFDERSFGLLAYYPFDGDAIDASGNGHNANFVGATLSADRSDTPDHAYSFNGGGQRIVIPASPVFEVSTNITITTWLKRNQLGVISPIVCKDDHQPNGTSHFEFRVQPNNRLMFAYYIPSERAWKVSESSSVINDSLWHHVAVTYDGQFVALYIDGDSVGVFPQPTPMIPGNEPLQIGEAQAAGFSYLNGAVDEVYIYKRALSPLEIQRLYMGQ